MPSNQYDPYAIVKVHIGLYDNPGKTLEFCSTCWSDLFARFAPKEPRTINEESHELRVTNLLTELLTLIQPEQ